MLQSTGSQRVRHNLVTEEQQQEIRNMNVKGVVHFLKPKYLKPLTASSSSGRFTAGRMPAGEEPLEIMQPRPSLSTKKKGIQRNL